MYARTRFLAQASADVPSWMELLQRVHEFSRWMAVCTLPELLVCRKLCTGESNHSCLGWDLQRLQKSGTW